MVEIVGMETKDSTQLLEVILTEPGGLTGKGMKDPQMMLLN